MVREAPSSDIRDPGNEEKLVCKQKLLHPCVHISITFPTYISLKLPPFVCVHVYVAHRWRSDDSE